MNNPKLKDDQWLDTALHEWANNPVGELPKELTRQVAQRMDLRIKRANYARGVLAVAAAVACLAVGLWIFSNRLATNKNLAGGISEKSIDDEPEEMEADLSEVESEVLLQEAQQKLDSLQAELMIYQLDGSLSSLDTRLEHAAEVVARSKQSLSHSLIEHQVISEWLANQ
jgi:uncharacterized protein YfcZ (UPF0381/DUF406 family)